MFGEGAATFPDFINWLRAHGPGNAPLDPNAYAPKAPPMAGYHGPLEGYRGPMASVPTPMQGYTGPMSPQMPTMGSAFMPNLGANPALDTPDFTGTFTDNPVPQLNMPAPAGLPPESSSSGSWATPLVNAFHSWNQMRGDTARRMMTNAQGRSSYNPLRWWEELGATALAPDAVGGMAKDFLSNEAAPATQGPSTLDMLKAMGGGSGAKTTPNPFAMDAGAGMPQVGMDQTVQMGQLPPMPPVPQMETVQPPDLTAYMKALEAAKPEKPKEDSGMLNSVAGLLSGALGAASHGGGVGQVLLGAAAGGAGGMLQAHKEHEQDVKDYQREMRGYQAALASGELTKATTSYNAAEKHAETGYNNALAVYNSQIQDMQRRQPKLTPTSGGGFMLQTVDKDGNVSARVTNPEMGLRVAMFNAASRQQLMMMRMAMRAGGGMGGLGGAFGDGTGMGGGTGSSKIPPFLSVNLGMAGMQHDQLAPLWTVIGLDQTRGGVGIQSALPPEELKRIDSEAMRMTTGMPGDDNTKYSTYQTYRIGQIGKYLLANPGAFQRLMGSMSQYSSPADGGDAQ